MPLRAEGRIPVGQRGRIQPRLGGRQHHRAATGRTACWRAGYFVRILRTTSHDRHRRWTEPDDNMLPDHLPSVTDSKVSDTIYLTIADRHGNIVSLIQSNYRGFGLGIVPADCGFMLHNRGHCSLWNLAQAKSICSHAIAAPTMSCICEYCRSRSSTKATCTRKRSRLWLGRCVLK